MLLWKLFYSQNSPLTKKVRTPYHKMHKIKPACNKCWNFFFLRFKNSVGICQGIGSHYSMSDTFTLKCISNSFGWLFLAIAMATVSTAISTSRGPSFIYIFLGRFSLAKQLILVVYLYQKPRWPLLSLRTAERSVSFFSAFIGASVSLCGTFLQQLFQSCF